MSHDEKVIVLLPAMEKGAIDFYHGVAFNTQIK